MSSASKRSGSATCLSLQRYADATLQPDVDWVASEEPLELRLLYQDATALHCAQLSITMRTPGHDFELAAGFLHGESIIRSASDVTSMAYCVEGGQEQLYNVVNVQLARGVAFDPARLLRHFYTTSSCGVCGKTSLQALEAQGCTPIAGDFRVPLELIGRLPHALRERQSLFERTGGLHAAGLFDAAGRVLAVREDVGRHNAVDKAIGWALMAGKLPLSQSVLVLSGRAGFELVQKAVLAGIPVVAAVGAPSSLAVTLAQRFQVTLLGFVSRERFNVYSGAQRLGAREGLAHGL